MTATTAYTEILQKNHSAWCGSPSVSEQQPEALIFCSRLVLCALSTPSLACLGYLTVIVRAALVDALYHVSPAKVA